MMQAGVQVEVGSMSIRQGAVCVLAACSRSSYLSLLSFLGPVIPENTPAVPEMIPFFHFVSQNLYATIILHLMALSHTGYGIVRKFL